MMSLRSRPIADSVDELLNGFTSRTKFSSADGKSDSEMERVVISGQSFILKHLDRRRDWIMRSTGDLTCRPVEMWRSGLLDALPDSIDHTIVGACWDGVAGAILMQDVSPWLIPEGDSVLELSDHLSFLDHMAQLHATFWEWPNDTELMPIEHRYLEFHPKWLPECERLLGGTAPVPTKFVPQGWSRLPEVAPDANRVIEPLHRDLTPLIHALETTPMTLIHGDWKAGNLGRHPDGRTILLDWAVPGISPPCSDIAWYVALNRSRLPISKEDTFDAFRSALERCDIDTGPWWDRQLSLCLLGAMVQFGWEKALGETPDQQTEMAWWSKKAIEGARQLA